MARVGIDLTSLPALKGGVAFYLLALVQALYRLDRGDNEYVLMARHAHSAAIGALAPGFSLVTPRLHSRPARLLWEQTGLPRVAERFALDVLHSPHYTRPLRRLRCASVVGVMDLTFFVTPQHHTWLKRRFFQTMLPASVRRADRVIAISESTKADLEKWLGVRPDRVDVTPLAVSDAFIPTIPSHEVEAVRDRYQLPARYILFVGRLAPRKNLPRLLEAYGQLLARCPSAPPLVLAGAWGWHRRELEAALQRLQTSVRTVGYVADADLPAVYVGADFFVYPSLYEGFGIPVLESLSCGVPTITSRGSSMGEVAGDAAELVDPSSVASISAAMERLLGDPARRAELRAKGLIRAKAFSWERTARLTRDSYLKAIEERSAVV
jgi:glycosyltransferase involved in cell wall biosynthesis